MKRTLLITLEYPPMIGGVSHYYANLVHALPDGEVFVLDNEKGELLSTSHWVWPKWLKGVWNTLRAVRKYKIEYLLVGQVLPLGTIALLLKRFAGIPYMVMTHGMDVTIPFAAGSSPRKQKLVRAILHQASAVTTVSSYTKAQLVSLGVPESKIAMVYPCPNIEVTDVQPSSVTMAELDRTHHVEGKRVLLSVGRLVERKGFDMVIAAMAKLRKDYPDLVYVIAGEGAYRARLEALVHKYQLASCIRFVGAVSNAELAAWYTRATAVIMPSRELPNHDVEGFGITFVEAGAFGKPVIGGNSGGVVDAVVDGQTGFLVEPTNLAMLTQAIISLLDNPQQAERLGAFGKKRVAEQFDWKTQARVLQSRIDTQL
jgi:phosphatidylinositol alpha-1,6-mannosyltransferase